MTIARDIIKKSLLKISAYGKGQSIPSEDYADALSALNSMISSWGVEGQLMFNEENQSFPLTQAVGEYTIGSGGDFNVAKPTRITSAFIRWNTSDYPLRIVTSDEYNRVFQKNYEGVPCYLNYIPNTPIGTIRIVDLPYSDMTLYITSETVLNSFPDLTTDVTFADGYERALVYNLAIELASEYQLEPSNTIIRIAAESKGIVENYNSRRASLVSDLNGIPDDNNNIGNIYNGYDS